MKANELRIGNDINIGGSTIDTYQTFKPTKVTINILKAIIEENIDRPDAILSMFQPIPLTEEWLVKFGFEKRVQDVCDYFYIGHNNVTHDWLFDLVWLKNSLTDKYEELPFYKNGRHEIKYVHQLQNLYFALTGEELVCLL